MEESLKKDSYDEPERFMCQETDLASLMDRALDLPQRDWSQYSPLTLAWIGDTVCDLVVRYALLKRANMQTDKLHRKASSIVNARSQAKRMEEIRTQLTDQEMSIYRRGRNANPGHTAKNADRSEYLEATGFECLMGYLYLERQYSRLLELMGEIG